VAQNGHHETITCPTSWTQSGTTAAQQGGGNMEASLTICYRFDGGEPSVNITSPSGATNGFNARVLAFRNVNATTPFDTANVNSVPGTLNQPNFGPTGLTTVTANAMALSFVSQDDGAANVPTLTLSTAQGFVAQYSSGVASTQSSAGAMANELIGTVGAVTFPTWLTDTSSTKSVWVGISIALRPA
jgi:hypothetical protein